MPQAKHVGCRLETLTKTHSSSEHPATGKMLQQGGSEPYEMELASSVDTSWNNSNNLYAYLGWWSSRLICIKQVLSYHFVKHFASGKLVTLVSSSETVTTHGKL